MAAADFLGSALTPIIAVILAFVALLFVLRMARSKVHRLVKSRRREDEEVSDMAYSALVTSEAIYREMRERGVESDKAEELLREARQAYSEARHREVEKLSSEARSILRERLQDEERVESDPITIIEEEIPDSKPLLGNEHPNNYLQARFLLSMMKDSLRKGTSPEKKAARKVMKEAKKAFEEERYTLALSLALNSKRILEGEETPSEGSEKNLCPDCEGPLSPSDTFCGKCGARLDGSLKCSGCGLRLEEEDKFCRKCGAAVMPLAQTS
ncbi:MAG: zinc ribbon domain-containing protein [Thermoplasmata archaeon]